MAISTSSGNNVSRNLSFVKRYFKSPVTLIVAVLSLVTLISKIMLFSGISDLVADTLSSKGVEEVPSMGFAYICSGIVTACLFLIFIFSISPSGGPTISFTVLHVMSVLELIAAALFALATFVTGIVFIFSTSMLVSYAVNSNILGMGEMTEEQIESLTRQVTALRLTLAIGMLIVLIIIGVFLYYINSQTAFLKSITLTCKNPQLKSKGAVPYGNLSIVIGLFQLIGVVIFYLAVGSADTSALDDMGITLPLDFTAISKPYMIFAIANAFYIVIRGYFAKGWEKFAKENEQYVYETVGAATRTSEASPMPTYKSTQRRSSEARQQSQPYLIGEEEDPNKKSSYIPEELQTDYNQDQMYGAPGMDPYGSNPYGGTPYGGNPYGGNPYGGNPYGGQFGADPFAAPADPFAQSPMPNNNPYGNNPYDGSQGGQGGYNNGMM